MKKRNWRRENPEKVAKHAHNFYIRNASEINAYCKHWRIKNRDNMAKWQRKYGIKYLYGITLEDLDRLQKRQNNKCAICQEEFGAKTPAVDHCHKSKNVRGLLCRQCNTGIGMFKDDPGIVQSAVAYLLSAISLKSEPLTPEIA